MTRQHTFSSAGHGNFSKIEHILKHKSSLNKYTIIESISFIFLNNNGIKLEINKRDMENMKTHGE
jgi:hypothetical protein